MGVSLQLCISVGSVLRKTMYKLLIASCLAAAATAAPSADAEPGYLLAAPALYNAYPNWPGVSTPFGSSTCFGCRGKRSADAEPGYGFYGYGVPLGLPYNGAVHGISQLHPTGHSFQHVARGKRSADADAYYGGYGYGGYGHHGYASHGYGL